jgi:hypothetical protein
MNRKKQARRLSFSFAVFLVAVLFSQVLIGWVFAKYFPVYTEASWYPFFISALPNYLIGMPLFLFMTRKIPESPLPGGRTLYSRHGIALCDHRDCHQQSVCDTGTVFAHTVCRAFRGG